VIHERAIVWHALRASIRSVRSSTQEPGRGLGTSDGGEPPSWRKRQTLSVQQRNLYSKSCVEYRTIRTFFSQFQV
jgi:hypothetical protein